MRKAFVIMAYKDPQQIERLIKRMEHPAFDFYIHVDKKIDITPFNYLADYQNVFFTKERWTIRWASYGFTKALLSIVSDVLSRTHYDFISSFSGQDYPIKSTQFIYDYYDKHLGHSFFSLENPDSPWWDHAITRVNKYHFTNFGFPGRYKLQFIVNKLTPRRNFPLFNKLYGGPRATWWTMSSDCAKYVCDFLDKEKKLQQFCTFTWAPDEFLIPTIVMNSDFRDKVVGDSGRYIDWSEGGSNPKILTSKDFEKLKMTDKLFARKFDVKIDTKVLDLIDEFTSR